MSEKKVNRGYLASTLGCHCPRCREGKLFKNQATLGVNKNLEMYKSCPVCGQITELEVGFYYGTSYVSYAMTVAISVSTFVAWWVLIGISTEMHLFYWLGANALILFVLQSRLMRLSRSLWISWFVKFDANWKENQPEDFSERLNADQAGNW